METSNIHSPPPFFEEIRSIARRRWEQLEADPDLAGPWWQLFSQVQSPRHVLSELLQNADDAGAVSASARIENDTFIFEHDGEDFNRDHFASLCRFGFSNKRNLHTIGFRGIGFKSTFSLGPAVDVITPTLAARFERTRFTEPVPISTELCNHLTQIRVKIESASRADELQKNLDEWSKSPVSLLFFHNIKKLTISGNTLERQILGVGPVPHSERVKLTGRESFEVIIIRSDEESFPDDAIEEIRNERITGEADFQLPPCRVEIVLGLPDEQRLYVILPTEVRHSLPFSCNAPFIQDPARIGIKDPSISPTNRWLLERLGRLTAQAMITWLENHEMPIAIRAGAYELLPLPIDQDARTDLPCEAIIKELFLLTIHDHKILLSVTGETESVDLCIAPPRVFYSVWTSDQLVRIFDTEANSVLAAEVTTHHRERLSSWKWLKTFQIPDILKRFNTPGAIPKPENWVSLFTLWDYVLTKLHNHLWGDQWTKLHILPVMGLNVLLSSDTVVRTSVGKLVVAEEDWAFFSGHLHVLDPSWITYISDLQKQNNKTGKDLPKGEIAQQILSKVGLERATSVDTLVIRAYASLLQQKEIPSPTMIRFTHIIASLDANVPDNFSYLTREGKLHTLQEGVALDMSGILEQILPEDYAEKYLLNDSYFTGFSSCTEKDWVAWATSEKSNLATFVGFTEKCDRVFSRKKLQEFIEAHHGTMPADNKFKLRSSDFFINDYDFIPSLLTHWGNLEKSDPQLWTKIVRLIALDPTKTWKNRLSPELSQMGRDYKYTVDCGELKATWIIKLQSLPCLEDTKGLSRKPTELLLRSKETESQFGIAPFVHQDLDTEDTKDLIKALGVRSSPVSPETIVQRIKIFSGQPNPPVYELVTLYMAIDSMLPRCNTQELSALQQIFAMETLIFTDQGGWATSSEVFLNQDPTENLDIPLVLSECRHLSMWSRLGVADRPTLGLLLNSLKNLKSGQQLEPQSSKRIQDLLALAPIRIWNEMGHWISLDRVWTPTSSFAYCLTMQGLIKWGDLFPTVKGKTADLHMLNVETITQPPFSSLKDLAVVITPQIAKKQDNLPKTVTKPWLVKLGKEMQRIKLDDEKQQTRIRTQAQRLEGTVWQSFRDLQVSSFIDGTPAGQPYSPDVFWDRQTLYVKAGPVAKIIAPLCGELARPFNQSQIAEAIKICAERDEQFIEEYLNSVFEMEEVRSEPLPEDEISDDTTRAKVITIEDLFEETEDDSPQQSSESASEESESVIETAAQEFNDRESDNSQSDPGEPDRRTRSREPSLIDRFTEQLGYQWVEDTKRYIHRNGSWFQHGEEGFNWELHSRDGEIMSRFWVSPQCLATKGIEINAEIWEMIKLEPTITAMVIEDEAGQPHALSGTELIAMVENEEVKVFPAKYRLRRKSE